jgi:hypothetical protein
LREEVAAVVLPPVAARDEPLLLDKQVLVHLRVPVGPTAGVVVVLKAVLLEQNQLQEELVPLVHMVPEAVGSSLTVGQTAVVLLRSSGVCPL